MTDFLAMGGYGAYIWPCYGLATVLMAALAALSARRAREAERQLDQLQQIRTDRPRERR